MTVDEVAEPDDAPAAERGHNRQPIVSVLGHVDHGKTSLLDMVRSIGSQRQASVMDREAGGITQHIGATEVPADVLNETCSAMLGGKNFKSPGLLFIDTPGHHSFASLRNRGGSVADIAVLVVDIMEGLQPQTIESLNILKETKTPFVIAGNKVDRLHGWRCEQGRSFIESFQAQREDVRDLFEDRYWKTVGQFSEHGFNLERYDQIRDFRQNVALVPMSAKEGEGLQDLLAVTVGLAERFLEDRLTDTLGPGQGTVLEMRDEVGKTLDIILYRGGLSVGDTIMLAGQDGPFTTHIKGLKRPQGMAEMRDAGKRWVNFDSVEAACGVKIVAPKLEATIAGTTLHLANTEEEIETAEEAIREEWRAVFNAMPVMCSSCSEIFARQDFASHTASGPCRGAEEDRTGVVIKADTVGGLEALAFELHQRNIPVRQATVGPVNKKDILMAQSASDPLQKVILGFSTKANTSDVAQQLEGDDGDVKFISGPIIYHIMDAFEEWQDATKALIEEEQRESIVYPGKVLFLKDHTFRAKGPAIVGMRVLGGRIHVGQRLMKLDGTPVGQVKSLRTRASEDVKEAMQGDEIAVAVQGPTVGRHIEELDEFYVDVPERHVKRLKKVDLSPVEEEILEEIVSLHRKDNHFWGR